MTRKREKGREGVGVSIRTLLSPHFDFVQRRPRRAGTPTGRGSDGTGIVIEKRKEDEEEEEEKLQNRRGRISHGAFHDASCIFDQSDLLRGRKRGSGSGWSSRDAARPSAFHPHRAIAIWDSSRGGIISHLLVRLELITCRKSAHVIDQHETKF